MIGQSIFYNGEFIPLCCFSPSSTSDIMRMDALTGKISFERDPDYKLSRLQPAPSYYDRPVYLYQHYIVLPVCNYFKPIVIWMYNLKELKFTHYVLKEIGDGTPGVVYGDSLILLGSLNWSENVVFDFKTLTSRKAQLSPPEIKLEKGLTKLCVLNDKIWGVSSFNGCWRDVGHSSSQIWEPGFLQVVSIDPIDFTIQLFDFLDMKLSCKFNYMTLVADPYASSLILHGNIATDTVKDLIKFDVSSVYIVKTKTNKLGELLWRELKTGRMIDCRVSFQ
jgi:hypothetical protein